MPRLKRYICSSWTEHTFEFYSAPTPWGPFTRMNSVGFGAYPWRTKRYGGNEQPRLLAAAGPDHRVAVRGEQT